MSVSGVLCENFREKTSSDLSASSLRFQSKDLRFVAPSASLSEAGIAKDGDFLIVLRTFPSPKHNENENTGRSPSEDDLRRLFGMISSSPSDATPTDSTRHSEEHPASAWRMAIPTMSAALEDADVGELMSRSTERREEEDEEEDDEADEDEENDDEEEEAEDEDATAERDRSGVSGHPHVPSPPADSLPDIPAASIQMLTEMGFTLNAARRALYFTRLDVEGAVDFCLRRSADPHLSDPLSADEMRLLGPLYRGGSAAFGGSRHSSSTSAFAAAATAAATAVAATTSASSPSSMTGRGRALLQMLSGGASEEIVRRMLNDSVIQRGLSTPAIAEGMLEYVLSSTEATDSSVLEVLQRISDILSSPVTTEEGRTGGESSPSAESAAASLPPPPPPPPHPPPPPPPSSDAAGGTPDGKTEDHKPPEGGDH